MSAKKLFIILAVLIILAAIVVAVINMKNETSTLGFPPPTPPRTTPLFPYEESTPSRQEIAVAPTSSSASETPSSVSEPLPTNLYQDSDNDGTPDWEEALKGTNGEAPATTSVKTTTVTYSPTSISSPTPPTTSTTSSSSYSFNPSFVSSTSTPPSSKPALVVYGNSLATAITTVNAEEEAAILTTALIQLPPGQTLLDTLKKEAKLSSQEAAAIAPFLPTPVSNEKGSENLKLLAADYTEAIRLLKAISVPTGAATLHNNLIAIFEDQVELLVQLSAEKKKGSLQYSTLTRFNTNSEEVVTALKKLAAFFKENKTAFTGSDVGNVFMSY